MPRLSETSWHWQNVEAVVLKFVSKACNSPGQDFTKESNQQAICRSWYTCVCMWNFSFKSEFFLLINKRIFPFCPGPLGPGQKEKILFLINKKNWLQKMLMYFEFCCFFWFALWYKATSDFKEKLYSPKVKNQAFYLNTSGSNPPGYFPFANLFCFQESMPGHERLLIQIFSKSLFFFFVLVHFFSALIHSFSALKWECQQEPLCIGTCVFFAGSTGQRMSSTSLLKFLQVQAKSAI